MSEKSKKGKGKKDGQSEVKEEKKKPEEVEKTSGEKKEEEKPEYYGQPVQKGDFILIDIYARTIPSGAGEKEIVFEASNPEDAKKLYNYDPKRAYTYRPAVLVVGDHVHALPDKVTEALESGEVKYGEDYRITLEPKDAFGERKAENIERMGIHKFVKVFGKAPKTGDTVRDEKKGREGVIMRIVQGKVWIDYNHPLAGKKVEYRLKVLKKYETVEEKVGALLEKHFTPDASTLIKTEIDSDAGKIDIIMPDFMAFQQNLGYAEFYLANELQNKLDFKEVNFIHRFKKPEPVTEIKPPEKKLDIGDLEEKEKEGKDSEEKKEEEKKEGVKEEEKKKEEKGEKKAGDEDEEEKKGGKKGGKKSTAKKKKKSTRGRKKKKEE